MSTVPAQLQPFLWKPGVSPNPGGRTTLKLITDEYRALAEAEVPREVFRKLKLKYVPGVKFKQLLALGQFLAGMKGSTYAAQEITDRLEGKVPQALTDADGGNLRLSASEVADEILELARMARQRAQTIETTATASPEP